MLSRSSHKIEENEIDFKKLNKYISYNTHLVLYLICLLFQFSINTCIYSGNGFKFHSKTFTKYYENHKRVNIYFLTEAYEFYLQYTP